MFCICKHFCCKRTKREFLGCVCKRTEQSPSCFCGGRHIEKGAQEAEGVSAKLGYLPTISESAHGFVIATVLISPWGNHRINYEMGTSEKSFLSRFFRAFACPTVWRWVLDVAISMRTNHNNTGVWNSCGVLGSVFCICKHFHLKIIMWQIQEKSFLSSFFKLLLAQPSEWRWVHEATVSTPTNYNNTGVRISCGMSGSTHFTYASIPFPENMQNRLTLDEREENKNSPYHSWEYQCIPCVFHGSTLIPGIHVSSLENLRKTYGKPEENTGIPRQPTAQRSSQQSFCWRIERRGAYAWTGSSTEDLYGERPLWQIISA